MLLPSSYTTLMLRRAQALSTFGVARTSIGYQDACVVSEKDVVGEATAIAESPARSTNGPSARREGSAHDAAGRMRIRPCVFPFVLRNSTAGCKFARALVGLHRLSTTPPGANRAP